MDVSEELKKQIDYAFLKSLISQLKGGSITPLQAKLLAKEFQPISKLTVKDLLHLGLKQFAEKYPEFKNVPLTLDAYVDSSTTQAVLDKMRQHMKAGELDEAIKVSATA